MQNGELGVIKVEQKVNPKAANMIDKPKGNKPAESVYFGPELNQVFLDQKNAWRIDRMRCNHVDAWALHAKAKQALEDSRQLARMGAPRIPSQLEDHVRYQDQRLGIYIKGRNTHGGRRTYATDIIGHMPIQFVGQQLRHAPGQEQMLFDHYADVKNGKNVERLKAYMEDYYKLGS